MGEGTPMTQARPRAPYATLTLLACSRRGGSGVTRWHRVRIEDTHSILLALHVAHPPEPASAVVVETASSPHETPTPIATFSVSHADGYAKEIRGFGTLLRARWEHPPGRVAGEWGLVALLKKTVQPPPSRVEA